jgi:hypothetical protein
VKPTLAGTSSDDLPSGTSPMLTNASRKSADSAAMIRPQASAKDSLARSSALLATLTMRGLTDFPHDLSS